MRLATTRVLAGLIALAAPATSAAAGDYYAGKSIDLLIGAPPGGGYDIYARALARHYGRHIPGQPIIVSKNMPGAASARGAGFIGQLVPQDRTGIAVVMPGGVGGQRLSLERCATGDGLLWRDGSHAAANLGASGSLESTAPIDADPAAGAQRVAHGDSDCRLDTGARFWRWRRNRPQPCRSPQKRHKIHIDGGSRGRAAGPSCGRCKSKRPDGDLAHSRVVSGRAGKARPSPHAS